MDALISGSSERRAPPLPGHGCASIAAMLLLMASGLAGAAPPRFDVHASLQVKSAAQAGSGFELQATLVPVKRSLEGGGFTVDAVAAPAGVCGGGDLIFADGFDTPHMVHSSGK